MAFPKKKLPGGGMGGATGRGKAGPAAGPSRGSFGKVSPPGSSMGGAPRPKPGPGTIPGPRKPR